MTDEVRKHLAVMLDFHRENPDYRKWAIKEEERVYRFHYMHFEKPELWQLEYCISRYSKNECIHHRWFVLLLSLYPTDYNYSRFEKIIPEGDKRKRRVLNGIIDLPDVSAEALRLIARHSPGRKKKSFYWKAMRRLRERGRWRIGSEVFDL